MADITVKKIDPHKAEKSLADLDSFSARQVTIDGHDVIVMMYTKGPTTNINAVERVIDAMSFMRVGFDMSVVVRRG